MMLTIGQLNYGSGWAQCCCCLKIAEFPGPVIGGYSYWIKGKATWALRRCTDCTNLDHAPEFNHLISSSSIIAIADDAPKGLQEPHLDEKFWCEDIGVEEILKCLRAQIVQGKATYDELLEVMDDDWKRAMKAVGLDEVRPAAVGGWGAGGSITLALSHPAVVDNTGPPPPGGRSSAPAGIGRACGPPCQQRGPVFHEQHGKEIQGPRSHHLVFRPREVHVF